MTFDIVKLAEDYKVSFDITNADQNMLKQLSNCYNKLAESIMSADNSYIVQNLEVYNTILNRIVIITSIGMAKAGLLPGLDKNTDAIFSSGNPNYIISLIKNGKLSGVRPMAQTPSIDTIRNSISTFGIPIVDNFVGDTLIEENDIQFDKFFDDKGIDEFINGGNDTKADNIISQSNEDDGEGLAIDENTFSDEELADLIMADNNEDALRNSNKESESHNINTDYNEDDEGLAIDENTFSDEELAGLMMADNNEDALRNSNKDSESHNIEAVNTDQDYNIDDDEDDEDYTIGEEELYDTEDNVPSGDVETPVVEPDQAPGTADISDADKDTQSDKTTNEEYRKFFGGKGSPVDVTIKTLMALFSNLYKSGFQSMKQIGIMALGRDGESSIVEITTVKKETENGEYRKYGFSRKNDSAAMTDNMICKALISAMPVFGVYHKTTDISELSERPGVCHLFHAQLQSANIHVASGRTSIRRWINETQLGDSRCSNMDEWLDKFNNGNKTRLVNLKKKKKWYEWCFENVIYDAFRDSGVACDLTDSTENKIRTILNIILDNLKNIIVVSERLAGETEELRISSINGNNTDNIVEVVKNVVNSKNDDTVVVRNLGHYGAVNKIKIIYDIDSENKEVVMAGDIIDNLIENDCIPTWSNCLLGKSESGEYVFWHKFMQGGAAGPQSLSDRCYCIYAASRSGKGIMTSTLLAAALADGKQIFYTDGKPENGACIGEIAWSRGKEAYTFNGTAVGDKPYQGSMEALSGSIRDVNEIYKYVTKLPKELFQDPTIFPKSDVYEFLGLMRYLKSLLTFAYLVHGRANGELDASEWQVWVFDEMTHMSSMELSAREKFLTYCENKGLSCKSATLTKTDKEGKQVTSKYFLGINRNKAYQKLMFEGTPDTGVEYIEKWTRMCSNIQKLIEEEAKKDLGKASVNLIFIFQEASWLRSHGGITVISSVVSKLKCIKIVGKDGISAGCGTFGDDTIRTPWREKIDSGTGWWVISNSTDLRSGVMLFKPFSIFTTKLNEFGYKDENYVLSGKEKLNYMDGYVTKILTSKGLEPGKVLQSAYDYADNAIKSLGYATSIKDYIYNCVDIGNEAGEFTLDEITDEGLNTGLRPENGHDDRGANFGMDTADLDVEDDIQYNRVLDFGIDDEEDAETENNTGNTGNTGNNTSIPFRKAAQQVVINQDDNADNTWFNTINTEMPFRTASSQASSQAAFNPGEPTDDADTEFEGQIEFDIPQEDEHNAQEDTGEQRYNPTNQGQGRPTRTVNSDPTPIIMTNTGEQPAMQMESGYISFKSNMRLAKALGLNNSNSIVIPIGGYKSPNKIAKLMQFGRGATYELQDRWEYILKQAIRLQGSSSITRVVITNDSIIFNNKIISTYGIVGGQDGVELEDIVSFKALAKKIKTIKVLRIDETIKAVATTEFNAEPCEALFNIMPNLTKICVLGYNSNKPDMELTRKDYYDYKEQLDAAYARDKQKEQIDIISDSYNNLRDRTGLGQARREKKLKNNTSGGWSKCKQAFKNDNYAGGLVRLALFVPKIIFMGAKQWFKS